ncbi:MAG TPA: hypothetical protein VH650_01050 [Gaiellaceae bacterium]
MGADEDGSALARLPAADDVAGRVKLGIEPELLEPLRQPGVRSRELGRPREAVDAAALVGADLRRVFEISRQRSHGAS